MTITEKSVIISPETEKTVSNHERRLDNELLGNAFHLLQILLHLVYGICSRCLDPALMAPHSSNKNRPDEMKGEIKMTTIEKIIAYFEENEDVFNDCIEELDSYNGYLGDDRYYSMDELSELYSGVDPIELLNRAYFGHDEDSYCMDQYGEKHYDAFNPNREYFRFNGYGNLVSTNYKDYSDHIDHYAIEEMEENRRYIDTIDNDDELSNLFDELENGEEETEEE